ncbi:MAG: CDP-diacylglycerol--serine O-phosphatidyltransferase [Holosporaceae bacterium]|jgi:CDP-diacylglycerol--serine O-phosphatidyltransferase|nr:CDP-diacylglycerol--serine O-phosphatidyltransferase [Holosporaceae bacterium]
MLDKEILYDNVGDVNKKNGTLMRFLPSTVTIAAFCCGLTAIKLALFQKWEMAVLCIFISALLDAFDGKVARLLGHSSQFGAQLDSLSDLVCFGVAPSLILFLKTGYMLENIGWGVCLFFSICCALRLARFNVAQIVGESKPDWAKKYFSGVPAPAGAILAIFPLVLFFKTGDYVFLCPTFVSFALLISGVLMISTLKTFSSKMIEIGSESALLALISISLLIICLITDLWLTLSIMVTLYIMLIPYSVYKYSKTQKTENQESCESKRCK